MVSHHHHHHHCFLKFGYFLFKNCPNPKAKKVFSNISEHSDWRFLNSATPNFCNNFYFFTHYRGGGSSTRPVSSEFSAGIRTLFCVESLLCSRYTLIKCLCWVRGIAYLFSLLRWGCINTPPLTREVGRKTCSPDLTHGPFLLQTSDWTEHLRCVFPLQCFLIYHRSYDLKIAQRWWNHRWF